MEDIERNNGKDQPYFMDEELLDIVDLKNEVQEEKGEEEAVLVKQEL